VAYFSFMKCALPVFLDFCYGLGLLGVGLQNLLNSLVKNYDH